VVQPNLIAGRWEPGAEGRPDINPSDTTDVVGHYASADADQARRAVAAAAEAA
jgi:alpha-ketoglutaric semialdehyde dehydrogenase